MISNIVIVILRKINRHCIHKVVHVWMLLCLGEDAFSGMNADDVDGAAESIEDGSNFGFAAEELSCDIVDATDDPVAAASPIATSKGDAASSLTAASALDMSASSSAPTPPCSLSRLSPPAQRPSCSLLTRCGSAEHAWCRDLSVFSTLVSASCHYCLG